MACAATEGGAEGQQGWRRRGEEGWQDVASGPSWVLPGLWGGKGKSVAAVCGGTRLAAVGAVAAP